MSQPVKNTFQREGIWQVLTPLAPGLVLETGLLLNSHYQTSELPTSGYLFVYVLLKRAPLGTSLVLLCLYSCMDNVFGAWQLSWLRIFLWTQTMVVTAPSFRLLDGTAGLCWPTCLHVTMPKPLAGTPCPIAPWCDFLAGNSTTAHQVHASGVSEPDP